MTGRRAAPTEQLDDRAVLAMLGAERLDLCALLDQLGPGEWSVPSLCAGWTVQDVVAHLTLSTRETTFDFVKGMLRHRGDFDRMNAANAQARARRCSPDELVEQLRGSAGSASTSFGSSPRDALIDVIVHGQDIARPLGRDRVTPPDRVVVALDHALRSRWYGAKKRLAHATLQASDRAWSAGAGPATIVGPVIDLLLVAAGRPSGVGGLTGSGVEELRRRLGP